MGRINIIGGSPLKMNFELANGKKSPKHFEVQLKKVGNWYQVVRKVGGKPLKTANANAANMTGTTRSERKVQVDFDE